MILDSTIDVYLKQTYQDYQQAKQYLWEYLCYKLFVKKANVSLVNPACCILLVSCTRAVK